VAAKYLPLLKRPASMEYNTVELKDNVNFKSPILTPMGLVVRKPLLRASIRASNTGLKNKTENPRTY